MAPSEELRSAVLSSVADLRDIPLAELSALSSDMLGRALGRALPGVPADLAPVGAFQSSI
jgi:FXSXX-COOH protein